MTLRLLITAALTLAVASGCGRKGGDPLAAQGAGQQGAGAPRFDPERPERSLLLDADEAARRIGSFEWTAGVEWTVSRQGSAESVRAVERHRLVQAATGEFLVENGIDPGLGEGAETGRDVIWAGSMTYARGRCAMARAARRPRPRRAAIPGRELRTGWRSGEPLRPPARARQRRRDEPPRPRGHPLCPLPRDRRRGGRAAVRHARLPAGRTRPRHEGAARPPRRGAARLGDG